MFFVDHVLHQFSDDFPKVNELYTKSDNAQCYHLKVCRISLKNLLENLYYLEALNIKRERNSVTMKPLWQEVFFVPSLMKGTTF